MELPQQFIHNVTTIWGNQGTQWLKELPNLVKLFSAQWHLIDVIPFSNLSYNFVARAYAANKNIPVVLKIGIPSIELLNEAKALEFYDGKGCVKLLGYDLKQGAMLLELIVPGITARSFFPARDEQAVQYACEVMNKLHTVPIKSDLQFPTINTWFSLFDTLQVPVQMQKHVIQAHSFAQELQSTANERYLLHGDLHHDNILLNEEGVAYAIDPKGVIGEKAYEVGAFMCNPAQLSAQANVGDILTKRLNQFSNKLKIDRHRLAKACYVRVILSACWTVQDKGDWRDDIYFAELILESC